MLRKVSISLATIAFIICFGLYKEHRGFDKGYTIGDEHCEILFDSVNFSGGITRTYEGFAYWYENIVWCLGIFLAAKLILEVKSIKQISGMIISSLITCVFTLGIALYQLRLLFREKSSRLPETLTLAYDDILRNSVPFDWICLFIVFILLII